MTYLSDSENLKAVVLSIDQYQMLSDQGSTPVRVIMHLDFDYFYAQCEELRRPEIKDKPVVVCVYSGRTEDSGVVSTSNYHARKHGIKSGIPIIVAKSKLTNIPDAVFLRLDMKYYLEKSEEAMSIIREFADKQEQVGIDECFIDVTEKTNRDFVRAKGQAKSIKQEIRSRLNLTCSIGIGPNKLLAKLGSDYQKPDGLTVVTPDTIDNFLLPLAVDKIPGIGPKTREKLDELGVITVGDLSKIDLFKLIEEFGKNTALYLYNSAKGVDLEPVEEIDSVKQIGKIVTLKNDASESNQMYSELQDLCRSVFDIAVLKNLSFKIVGINLILSNLENVSRSKSLKVHSANYDELYSAAKSALDEAMSLAIIKEGKRVRRLGVKLADLKDIQGQNSITDFF